MHCGQCGQDVAVESVFCPKCGHRLDGAATPPPPPPPVDRPNGAERLRPGQQNSGNSPAAEVEIWSGTYSPKAMIGQFAAAAVVTVAGLFLAALAPAPGMTIAAVGALVIWGALLLMLAYRRLTVRYRLTTYRFFHELGLLSRVGNRIEVIDIDDVAVQQGLVERMFSVGTIEIHSSDRSDPVLRLPGIDDAKQVADQIDDVRRAERHRRGLHIEAI